MKKKEIIPLIDEENESYEKQKVWYICKKYFDTDEFDTDESNKNDSSADENDNNEFNTDENDKNDFSADENDKNALKLYDKVKYHCHYTGKIRGAAHNICNLRYKTPK